MQRQNEYIGDDNFKKFLDHYDCKVPLEVVKMRFAGAICSPSFELRPTDVISSFWPEGLSPRLETKNEAELFFKFFMGLWDKIFEDIGFNCLKLSKQDTLTPEERADMRYEEIALGFLEGFWGGLNDLKIPAYLGEVIDSLEELAGVYQILKKRAKKGEDVKMIVSTLSDTDKMVQKALSFIVENFALPRIRQIGTDSLKN